MDDLSPIRPSSGKGSAHGGDEQSATEHTVIITDGHTACLHTAATRVVAKRASMRMQQIQMRENLDRRCMRNRPWPPPSDPAMETNRNPEGEGLGSFIRRSFMASKENQHQSQQQQLQLEQHQSSYGEIQASSSMHGNFISKEAGAYDLGELDQAFFLYFEGQDHPSSVQDQRRLFHLSSFFFCHFRELKMHEEQESGSKRASVTSMELAKPRNDPASGPTSAKDTTKGVKRKGPTSNSEQEGPKTPDPKTLRRLAQNREAARKSRLRKKAYVQQLETSRIRLTQLEQELQRARAQMSIMYFLINHSLLAAEAAIFDMEYTRWLEEDHRLMCELQAAMQEHVAENELRMFVDNCLAHFDQMMNLKSMVVKADVFHLVSGMWKTPAERCFMWMGGFRPSELIKVNHPKPHPFVLSFLSKFGHD
ncbi:bZIP transcription factor tga10 [Asimina triloba]